MMTVGVLRAPVRSDIKVRGRFVWSGIGVATLVGLLGWSLWSLGQSARQVDWQVAPHRFVLPPDQRDRLLEPPHLRAAIDRSTLYLVRACEDDGRFVYSRDLERPRFRSARYNVLRHAGAIYALCQRQTWMPHDEVPEAIRRAVTFLQRETFMRLPGRDDLLAIWSPPALTGTSGPLEAKLGGTGLGLVALVDAESIVQGLSQRDDLMALGEFLIYMQRPDGSFYSKFIPSAGGRRGDWISLYYPGEAALGLVRLHEFSGDRRFGHAARRALLFLADSRAGQAKVPADHWALLATASLMNKDSGMSPSEDERQRLILHAAQIATAMLAEQRRSNRSPYTWGAFTSDGRTTPTATRVEGLMAALTILPDEQAALRDQIKAACDDATRFLLAAQVRDGPFAGGMPRGVGRLRPIWDDSTRAYNQRSGEIRVDYVQHALSAWIQYTRYHPAPAMPRPHATGFSSP
jgi:outer membrane murein-binding lipoprotein Lpp